MSDTYLDMIWGDFDLHKTKYKCGYCQKSLGVNKDYAQKHVDSCQKLEKKGKNNE